MSARNLKKYTRFIIHFLKFHLNFHLPLFLGYFFVVYVTMNIPHTYRDDRAFSMSTTDTWMPFPRNWPISCIVQLWKQSWFSFHLRNGWESLYVWLFTGMLMTLTLLTKTVCMAGLSLLRFAEKTETACCKIYERLSFLHVCLCIQFVSSVALRFGALKSVGL